MKDRDTRVSMLGPVSRFNLRELEQSHLGTHHKSQRPQSLHGSYRDSALNLYPGHVHLRGMKLELLCFLGPCKVSVFTGRVPFTVAVVPPITLQCNLLYRRTSISGTTFSGKKCPSGTIFHAI
jgi:hypothetical protein